MGAGSTGHLLAGLGQDLRYGFRTLHKNPGFTAVAMLARPSPHSVFLTGYALRRDTHVITAPMQTMIAAETNGR